MMTTGKNRFGWRHSLIGLAALLLPATVNADVVVPKKFVPGTKIVAAEVNDNFTALADAIDTKQDRIKGVCKPGEAVVSVLDDGSLLCGPPPAPLVGSGTLPADGVVGSGTTQFWPSGATITPPKDVKCLVSVNAMISDLGTTGRARLFPAVKVDNGPGAVAGGAPGAPFPKRGEGDTFTGAANTSTVSVAAGTTAQLGCAFDVSGVNSFMTAKCWVSWFCH